MNRRVMHGLEVLIPTAKQLQERASQRCAMHAMCAWLTHR